MSQSAANAVDYRGSDEGGKLKEVGTAHWKSPNTGATNEVGFTALPAGSRQGSSGFLALTEIALFWTSSLYSNSNPLYRYLVNGRSDIYRHSFYKEHGFSVRCVKD